MEEIPTNQHQLRTFDSPWKRMRCTKREAHVDDATLETSLERDVILNSRSFLFLCFICLIYLFFYLVGWFFLFIKIYTTNSSGEMPKLQ